MRHRNESESRTTSFFICNLSDFSIKFLKNEFSLNYDENLIAVENSLHLKEQQETDKVESHMFHFQKSQNGTSLPFF